jgi:hypothetical protein
MFSTFQTIIETLAGSFFLVVAIVCLLWPEKLYAHALRPQYRKSDIGDEPLQNLERRGYFWTVRIIGAIAAIMFFFIVIHLLSSKPIGHRDTTRPVIIVPKVGEEKSR